VEVVTVQYTKRGLTVREEGGGNNACVEKSAVSAGIGTQTMPKDRQKRGCGGGPHSRGEKGNCCGERRPVDKINHEEKRAGRKK